MNKQIFVNLPVSDMNESTKFYQELGFTMNPAFSNESGSCMVWSDEIAVMLLAHDFYKSFFINKEIADTKRTSGVLLCLSMESKEAVQHFADTAKKNGGDFYQVESGAPADMMFGLEVQDIDGHTWEPMWMSPEFNPQSEA
ncbi:MAG: Glyoxalase family protein [Candidatus Saccharibacteria bacterium]|jgi:predicted lactoylglutathione lyase|nr:Glyoxalase family protein [Candidatus Saccharibacteria bacterium]